MQQIPLDQMTKTLIKEALNRKTMIMFGFTAITLCCLIIGLFWPKSYLSSTSVIADDKKIIRPLMKGNAETTNITDHIRIAKEVLFSRSIMDQILITGGWADYSPVEQERQINKIKENIEIGRGGTNLIKISYQDNEPERAFRITQQLADLFISESERSNRAESKEAYEFIDKQVGIYHQKLIAAEARLKDLREENFDARPGSDQEVNTRINRLLDDIRAARVALRESEIRRVSLEEQLSGEAKVAKNISRISFYRQRIADLEMQLDALRLSYHESYPDIVHIKSQITELKKSLTHEEDIARAAGTLVGVTTIPTSPNMQPNQPPGTSLNPVYTELRAHLAQTITNIETNRARIAETEGFLKVEMERLQRISDGEALLSDFTRDYEVHKAIYQDLLKRRERARVSLNLQLENQGVNFKIQEPANLPLTPSGMRFIYFAILGPFLGLAAPLGLIYALLVIDGRVRYDRVLVEQFNLPLLGHVPHIASPQELKSERTAYMYCAMMGGAVVLAYAITGWLKFAEVI